MSGISTYNLSGGHEMSGILQKKNKLHFLGCRYYILTELTTAELNFANITRSVQNPTAKCRGQDKNEFGTKADMRQN